MYNMQKCMSEKLVGMTIFVNLYVRNVITKATTMPYYIMTLNPTIKCPSLVCLQGNIQIQHLYMTLEEELTHALVASWMSPCNPDFKLCCPLLFLNRGIVSTTLWISNNPTLFVIVYNFWPAYRIAILVHFLPWSQWFSIQNQFSIPWVGHRNNLPIA